MEFREIDRIETPNGVFRIIERQDPYVDLDNLKGDCYNPDLIKEMGYVGNVEELRAEELEFEELVSREGVFGYVLEKWDPAPDAGWEHVSSCWGFVGQYSETDKSGLFNHYIVDELRSQIK